MAIDPGPHCGLAVRLPTGQATTMMIYNDWPQVVKFIREFEPEVVVIERFATAGRISADGLETVAIVGRIEGVCHLLGIEFVKMTPMQRKAWESEAKAMKITKGPHELDALMHLLSYEYRTTHR